MASDRRMGVEGSATWSLLLDAAERLIRDKGYGAVTSRLLGKEAGLSPQIVYFYFRSMDDVFSAVFNRLAESLFEHLEDAAASDQPLVEMWKINCDPKLASLKIEFVGLSNHRERLRGEIAAFGREYNRRQAMLVEQVLGAGGKDPFQIPPSVIASILENLGLSFAMAEGFDILSHELARSLITEFLRTRFPAT